VNWAPRNTILLGDALEHLIQLPDESVDTVITSPPYYNLRSYGVAGQIGLEHTVDEWVERLHLVMDELHRVLAPHGSAWLDLGDSYSRHPKFGAPTKSLFMAPERLILRQIQSKFVLRNRVVWSKTNPMPDAVTDRLTNTYDVVFHLVKQGQRRYFYDLDAIRVPEAGGLVGKNPGDVFRLPASNYRGPHHATFPERLIERPMLATCPVRVCVDCGKPWQRQPGRTVTIGKRVSPGQDPKIRRYRGSWRTLRELGDLKPSCKCSGLDRPGLVLDPFFGTGTVGSVARRLGRDWLGIELNPTYVALARERLELHPPPLEEAA
jgi:site-specific DNA-methyltransferase (adenine-specific)